MRTLPIPHAGSVADWAWRTRGMAVEQMMILYKVFAVPFEVVVVKVSKTTPMAWAYSDDYHNAYAITIANDDRILMSVLPKNPSIEARLRFLEKNKHLDEYLAQLGVQGKP